MTTRLTILLKGLILIAVPLFFQLAFITLVSRMRDDVTRAADLTIHTKDVIAQAQSCRARLLTAHGAIQGFILTRDPSFQETLRRSFSDSPWMRSWSFMMPSSNASGRGGHPGT